MSSSATPADPTALAPRLVARTQKLATTEPLLELLPPDSPVAWIRRGEGIVGWGVAAVVRTGGAQRFRAAADWWTQVARAAIVRDDVNLPGTGLVAFGSFAFAADPGHSVLVVPEVIVGRRQDDHWVTVISHADTLAAPPVLARQSAPQPPQEVEFGRGSLTQSAWMERIRAAIARIEAGELEKVVLARDLHVTTADKLDTRWPLQQLAQAYPMCWTFHVDGIFGATPEMLVRRERGLVTSRVLAGTISRTGDEHRDLASAASLAHSSKDLEEHEYAVRSVADALEPHCTSMNVPEAPFVLHLPNVMHLATDVAGVARDGDDSTVLDLAAALHPSAAVGGTPTPDAVAMIAELEGMDRCRYAGPVGWIDGAGDGEFGIALRSAEVEADRIRLFAGCGIVAGSDPEAELVESRAKFEPVIGALTPPPTTSQS